MHELKIIAFDVHVFLGQPPFIKSYNLFRYVHVNVGLQIKNKLRVFAETF